MDWNIYFVALEIEVREGRAPMVLLLRGLEIYDHIFDQPEPGHPVRLNKEWATRLASAA